MKIYQHYIEVRGEVLPTPRGTTAKGFQVFTYEDRFPDTSTSC